MFGEIRELARQRAELDEMISEAKALAKKPKPKRDTKPKRDKSKLKKKKKIANKSRKINR